MCILLSFQPEYKTYYDKCKLIKEKFVEKYAGDWRVIIFNQDCGDSFGNYKDIYLYINYNGLSFIILNNK